MKQVINFSTKRYQFYTLVKVFIPLLLFLQGCSSPADNAKATVESTMHEVIIRDMKFIPAELWIQSGDQVVFINKDMLTHDVSEEMNKAWSSGPIMAGASWTSSFTASADYMCTLHPVMKGKIIVR